jgi:hypothetical protein
VNLHVIHLRNGFTVTAKYDYHVKGFAVVVRNPELRTCDKRNFQLIVPDIRELFAMLEEYSAVRVERIAGEATA